MKRDSAHNKRFFCPESHGFEQWPIGWQGDNENVLYTPPALDQNTIVDSLAKQIASFQKTFIWTALFAAVIGLGSVDGKETEVCILGVDIDKAKAYKIYLGGVTLRNTG